MIEYFRPKECLESIYQVDFEGLRNRKIKGLIMDLDETLLPREMNAITPVLFSFIDRIKSYGFSIYLLSNSMREERVEHVGKTLSIPWMTLSMKPLPFAFNHVRTKFGLESREIAVIGDQLFMDILGGNLSGMHTILVRPMSPETMWIRKVMRLLEKWVLDRLEIS